MRRRGEVRYDVCKGSEAVRGGKKRSEVVLDVS